MSPFEIRLRAMFVKWRGYGRTYQIAKHFDIETALARRFMHQLEKRGVVRRSRYSAVNDTSWEFCDGTGRSS